MDFLATVLIVFIIGTLLGIVGWFWIVYLNSRKPEVTRKWTDPKFRDHLTPRS